RCAMPEASSEFGTYDVDRSAQIVSKSCKRNSTGTEDMKFGDGATLEVMHEAYGDARFCFVPRGKSGWSLRFFE
ncbi:unnamed protein product, partial [Symbiodinium pilosum]